MFPSYKHLLDLYFAQANGRQIIAHQIESFNHFMDVEIPTIIKQVNPVLIRGSPEIPLSGPRSALASATGLSTSAANALLGKEAIAFNQGGAKHEYEVCIEFENPQIRKPTIFENNGSIQPMMPNDARLRNFTYASPLCVDIRIKTTFIDNTRGSIRETKQRVFPNVHLGKIPVMVGSKYCLLHEQSHLESREIGECAEDLGGYFIIQGGERVIISQERMSENRPFVFRNNRNPIRDVEVVEIKCISPKNEQVPKSNAVKIMYHPKNPQIHLLRVQIPRIKTEVPLFIVFRALGILADKDAIDLILGPDGDSCYDDILQESIEEAGFVITQEQAHMYLSEQAAVSTSKAQRHIRVEDLLAEELFPHIGKSNVAYEKACFLAHMTRKVLWISSRRIQTDDRDGYPNKRVDLPGFLLANLIRSYFSMKMVKDMKAAIAKEIHSGSWRANGNYEDILNISNIYKVVKSTILEVGLKSSLATGNFGNAKLGGPAKIGVSQVLNRLNYISGVSHLRRVSTPIEKTGKLVPPRKLNNTQWGFICPSETPEGHSVGVVKNMSSVANVSIYSNPANVREFIERTGLCISLKDSTIEEKTVGARIFLNGVWLGTVIPEKTMMLVNSLRRAKRCGQIHIHTGLVWKSSLKELWISVEAGRILRPVLYAPAIREIAGDLTGSLRKQIDEMTDWESILLWQTPSGKNLIEYIDSGESEGAYIAMTPEKALEDISTTHCEIHPSTILGTIASNIPFPDHNQSPRNSYQCLWVGEKVRMANGTEKRICDIEVGDEVVTVDRDTHETSTSRVCYQYVRSTDKKIYKVNISGNREVIATEDHCFMTDHGPIRVDELDSTKHQMAINIGPDPVSIYVDRKIILDEETVLTKGTEAGIHKSMLESHIETLKAIGLLPLYSDHSHVPILARICGLACTDGSLNVYIKTKTIGNKTYTYSLPQFQAHFGGILSANIFEKDMATLKLPEVSVRESLRIIDGRQRHTWFVQHNGPLPTLLIALGASFGKKTETARLPVPEWIMNGSLMTKREFLGGFQGGDGCRISITNSGLSCYARCEQTSQQAHPEIADKLREYMMQIIKLFSNFGISVHMREDEEVSDSRIRLRYKMENGVKTLMKFWKSIGYRYDEHKNSASAIVMEFLKAHSEEKIPYTKWTEWLSKVRCLGETIFIPLLSVEPHKNVNIADITVFNDNHTFVTTNSTIVTNCAMGKQAMGVYALNYRERYDAMSHVLCYPNVPLVSPFMSKFYGLQTMPSGENIVVAIMTYSGYNQEDSIMINRASLERGRFRSIFYRTYKDEEKKNQSSGEEERFDCPDPAFTRQMKHANYDKLGPDGFIPENTYVDSDDILIGKVVPLRVPTGMVLPAGTKRFRDVSRMPRNNEWGYIDKIFKNRNGEGYSFVKIRVRQDRMPEIGDKFSSRHGQKGTCGMILDPQDMPQTASGIVPDIIINPHCIPSRMTIAQLMETLLGRICCEAGGIGDGSPFNGITLEWMAETLLKYGIEPYSNEILYNGYTGRQMETKIFMGPCFYQRLRHCSADKMHSRASGPLVMLTRQPAEGRAREGGLRFGEMERDAVLAHGITEFTKERLMECSDGFRCWTCRECGLIAVANQREGIWECRSCGNRTGFANIQIPYAYKLLLQELETMNITSRILTQGKFLQIKDRAGQCN